MLPVMYGPVVLAGRSAQGETWLLGASWAAKRLDTYARRSAGDSKTRRSARLQVQAGGGPKLVIGAKGRWGEVWQVLHLDGQDSSFGGSTRVEMTSFSNCPKPPDLLVVQIAYGDDTDSSSARLELIPVTWPSLPSDSRAS